jgi:hypothetical protein
LDRLTGNALSSECTKVTGVAQSVQLLGSAWQLPAVLSVVWFGLIVLRRRIPPWYFVVATGACSAVPLFAFLGAELAGRGSGREQDAGPVGAGIDIPLWSLLSVMTGLISVIVLVLLTGVVELARFWLTRSARPNARTRAVAGRKKPEVALRFHWRAAASSEMSRLSAREDPGAVAQQLHRPVTFDPSGEGSAGGMTGLG